MRSRATAIRARAGPTPAPAVILLLTVPGTVKTPGPFSARSSVFTVPGTVKGRVRTAPGPRERRRGRFVSAATTSTGSGRDGACPSRAAGADRSLRCQALLRRPDRFPLVPASLQCQALLRDASGRPAAEGGVVAGVSSRRRRPRPPPLRVRGRRPGLLRRERRPAGAGGGRGRVATRGLDGEVADDGSLTRPRRAAIRAA